MKKITCFKKAKVQNTVKFSQILAQTAKSVAKITIYLHSEVLLQVPFASICLISPRNINKTLMENKCKMANTMVLQQEIKNVKIFQSHKHLYTKQLANNPNDC